MAKAKLGSGARFAALQNKLGNRPGVTHPGALAAFIGRKKIGKKKFQKLAAKGAKRKAHPDNSHTVKDTGPHGGNKPRTQAGHAVHPPAHSNMRSGNPFGR